MPETRKTTVATSSKSSWYGQIPFDRPEWAAEMVTAFFDVARLHGTDIRVQTPPASGTCTPRTAGTWVSYADAARPLLAIILLAAAGGLAYAGIRFRHPVRVPSAGRARTVFMILAWVIALAALVACWTAYVRQELREHIAKAPPANPITMVTLTAAVVLSVVVFIATPRGLGVRLSSAVIAAMAAPMIFELPFDLIVMARTYPPVPPDPVLYRTLFFAPLFLVELTTLSLLAVSPMVKLSRPAFFCLALMLLVFAVWALAGFGYPSAPIPIAMNVVSKILAFVTALSLFFPEWFTRWRRSQPDPGIEQAADASELQPQAA